MCVVCVCVRVFQKSVLLFSGICWPPWGREWDQNVPLGAGFRTPKYRPNPANGGPTGCKNMFVKRSQELSSVGASSSKRRVFLPNPAKSEQRIANEVPG